MPPEDPHQIECHLGRLMDERGMTPKYAGAGAETTAIAISNRITAALNEADHADQEISARLNHFAANAGNGMGLDAAMVAKDQAAETAREQIPAKGTDPASVKKWWDGLTETEQQKFIHDNPDQVGNLDGVPAAVRDQANRLNLTRAQADLQKQLSDLEKSEPLSVAGTPYGATESPDHIVWKAQRDALQDKLKGLNALQDRLDLPVSEKDKAADLNIDLAKGTKMDPSRVYAVLGGGDSITDWTPDPFSPDNYNPFTSRCSIDLGDREFESADSVG
ncbi:hypothetical protein OG535_39190 [Kitasatospora sp. NBC_00085]|uniref:hypothetical protein n=1 Tax=unclassified Kitasatospora TaxID=2633591 RepID=UPI0032483C8A